MGGAAEGVVVGLRGGGVGGWYSGGGVGGGRCGSGREVGFRGLSA